MAIRRFYRQIMRSTNEQGARFVMCDDCFKLVNPKNGIMIEGIDGEVPAGEVCFNCKPEGQLPSSGVRDTSLAAFRRQVSSGAMGKQEEVVWQCLDRFGPGTRDDLAERTGIRLASICGAVNKMVTEGRLMDWRTIPNPRTDNETNCHVVEIYNPNDLEPGTSRLL